MASLRDRVSLIPAGDLDAMERTANAAIEDLRTQYRSVSLKTVDRLQQLVQQATTDAPQWHDEAYRLAHDLKGQGATFDQELVTTIAAALCKLLRAQEKGLADDFVKRASAHCEAIRVILNTDVRGTGGDHGAALLRLLAIAV